MKHNFIVYVIEYDGKSEQRLKEHLKTLRIVKQWQTLSVLKCWYLPTT